MIPSLFSKICPAMTNFFQVAANDQHRRDKTSLPIYTYCKNMLKLACFQGQEPPNSDAEFGGIFDLVYFNQLHPKHSFFENVQNIQMKHISANIFLEMCTK